LGLWLCEYGEILGQRGEDSWGIAKLPIEYGLCQVFLGLWVCECGEILGQRFETIW
jgi:hypothetical protein